MTSFMEIMIRFILPGLSLMQSTITMTMMAMIRRQIMTMRRMFHWLFDSPVEAPLVGVGLVT